MKNTQRKSLLAIITALFILGIGAVQAAPNGIGSYTTPTSAGSIKFTPVKAVRIGSYGVAYQGNYNVSGKVSPGILYGANMTWYYTPNYETKAQAALTLQPDGTYTGTITFYDKKGNVTSTGTALMMFK